MTMSRTESRSPVVRPLAILGSLALVFSITAWADITGRAVGVTDGDTITVLDASGIRHKVRLAGIDAPERGQPGGFRSKESLSRLVFEQQVRVEGAANERDGLLVGKVWVAPPDCPSCGMTLDAGLAQITTGRAWWFRRQAKERSPDDQRRYEFAEQEARAKKVGLWRERDPVPPWEWRKERHRN
jgi:endonuclease YncB( thermonuclease family)